MVEVVDVMVVREQHPVDRRQLVGPERGTALLGQLHAGARAVRAWRIERRIGREAQAEVLDQRRRTAQQADR
ncbi:MAG: hypothetical protein WBP81_22820 [Solirubrobacteraceae bacterium]